MNIMKYYVDANSNYLGGWEENPPAGAIEVPFPPDDARQPWTGDGWAAAPVVIPDFVTMRQAQRQLASVGLLAQVQLFLESMEGDEGVLARIDWNTAGKLERANPLLQQVTLALGLTSEEVDELFIQASAL